MWDATGPPVDATLDGMKRHVYTDDHEDFRTVVREFVSRDVVPHLDAMRDAHGMPRETWLAAGRAGLLGLEVPEEHGGAGVDDYRFNAVLFEELARAGAALPSMVGIHADVVPPYLVELTTPEQRDRWLPGVASGEILTAIAMTEPTAGSDLAGIRTFARPDGDGWRLSGSKTFITNGGSADLVVVAAKTDPGAGSKGVTLFAVSAQAEGFARGTVLDKVGQAEADTAELFFDDVRVTEADVLGEVDRGFVHLMTFLPQERLGCAVTNLAHARHHAGLTMDYIRERTAFGRPIGALQHNKFLAAEIMTSLDVCQAFVDACVVSHSRGELSAVDAAKAKWWTAQVQSEVLDHCVQLHGGYGYMNEYPVARAWRDARVTKIWAGSNEIMKEIIGRDLGL